MAFRLTPRFLPGLPPGLPVALARNNSGVCKPDPPAPPCPCPPKCPPPCRCPPPERLRARRVVCCPPPQGQKPPCAPKAPACSLTCANIASAHTVSTNKDYPISSLPSPGATECDKHQDLVARRLAAALAERRRQYAEDALRCEPCQETPSPYLRVAGIRDCENATDGKTYILKHEPGNATAPLPCGPCRTPPPDGCLEIVPDNKCIVKKGKGIDPCAHKPRVFLHIDRSGCGTKPPPEQDSKNVTMAVSNEQTSNSTPPCPSPVQKCKENNQSSSEGFTSRIMKTLGVKSSGDKIQPPKCGEDGPAPGPGKARYAGDQSWCKTASAAKPGPVRCRPSTLSERLGRRPPAPCTRRKLHTSVALAACEAEPKKKAPQDMAKFAEKIKADNAKLEKVLQERKQLKDSALGRSAVCEKKKKCEPKPPVHGCFDIQVPPTSGRPLRLRVFYDEVCVPVPPRCPNKEPPLTAPSSKSFSSCSKTGGSSLSGAAPKPPNTTGTGICSKSSSSDAKGSKSDSWLSMKSLKKTIAGCVKADSADKKPPKKAGCGGGKEGSIKPVCPPPGPSPKCHPGLTPRCPPPPEPPKRDPCDSRPCCNPPDGGSKSKDNKDKKKKC